MFNKLKNWWNKPWTNATFVKWFVIYPIAYCIAMCAMILGYNHYCEKKHK